jgi:hypothetical protein
MIQGFERLRLRIQHRTVPYIGRADLHPSPVAAIRHLLGPSNMPLDSYSSFIANTIKGNMDTKKNSVNRSSNIECQWVVYGVSAYVQMYVQMFVCM